MDADRFVDIVKWVDENKGLQIELELVITREQLWYSEREAKKANQQSTTKCPGACAHWARRWCNPTTGVKVNNRVILIRISISGKVGFGVNIRVEVSAWLVKMNHHNYCMYFRF